MRQGQVPQIDKSRIARAQRLRGEGREDPVIAMLASRQAAVRTTYSRSINELSASPSAVDQHVARSLELFVATMPEPEPNSVRAMRLASERTPEPIVAAPVRSSILIPGASVLRADTGIDILTALHQRMAAPDAKPKAPVDDKKPAPAPSDDRANHIRDLIEKSLAPAGKDDDPDRAVTLSDRLRAITEKISDPSQPIDVSRHDEIVRKAEEQNRERLERDRAKDRGGPSR